MTDEQIKRAVRTEQRSRAVRDAAALRLVGAAVAVAASARKTRRYGISPPEYVVPQGHMEALLEAARAAGFKV